MCTYHLASTGSTTGQNLMGVFDAVGVLVGEVSTNKVVDGQLNSLLRSHTNQLRNDTRVQACETLVADNLPGAIDGVVVQSLTRARRALILHTGLDQINRVNHE